MTSIFEGQPPLNKAFSYQSKDHLGSRYIVVGSFNPFDILIAGWTNVSTKWRDSHIDWTMDQYWKMDQQKSFDSS